LPIIPPSVQFGWVEVEDVQHDAGLYDRAPRVEVDVLDPVAVLRPVDDDGRVRALSGQAGASAAGEERSVVPGGDPDGDRRGVRGPGDHDAEGELTVVRRVSGVGAEAARVEPDLAVDPLPQQPLKRGAVDGRRASPADDRIGQRNARHS
jgi:hypothetical protein